MKYKFAPNINYEFLSAGSVIKSYKGNNNFPVRLGNEIFHRCLTYTNKNKQINIYDPMCGSGYLLTTIGIQNFNKLNTVYGSDINRNYINNS